MFFNISQVELETSQREGYELIIAVVTVSYNLKLRGTFN